MKVNLTKYFWDLNERALRETEGILKNPSHHKFIGRLVTFLSRCQQPKELFSILTKKEFIEVWPKARSYWIKIARESDFRDWWETIYEQIIQGYRGNKKPVGSASGLFLKIGRMLKDARIQKGLSQNELAFKVGMRQPDISRIEEGKKNITLETLACLCRVLDIKRIDLI